MLIGFSNCCSEGSQGDTLLALWPRPMWSTAHCYLSFEFIHKSGSTWLATVSAQIRATVSDWTTHTHTQSLVSLMLFSSGSCMDQWHLRAGACVRCRCLQKPTGKVGHCLLRKSIIHSQLPQVQLPSHRENYFGASYHAHYLSFLYLDGDTSPKLCGKIRIEDCKSLGLKVCMYLNLLYGLEGAQNYAPIGCGSNPRPLILESLSPTSLRILNLQK